MKNTLYILLIGILFSCKNGGEKISTESDSTSISYPISDNQKTSDSKSEVYDTINSPSVNANYLGKILATGYYHEDEVQKEMLNNDWYGIFKNTDSIYIGRTNLIARRVFDSIIDEDSTLGKTGWKIETSNKDSSFILISGLKSIKPRIIKETVLNNTVILPGDSLTITFNDLNYKFYASGSLVKPSNGNESYYKNYKLYISTSKNGIEITQLIVAKPYFVDNYVKFIWAGDLDGDNLLDIIMDTSNHYNATIPTLFLSGHANSNEILKVVGLHLSVGC